MTRRKKRAADFGFKQEKKNWRWNNMGTIRSQPINWQQYICCTIIKVVHFILKSTWHKVYEIVCVNGSMSTRCKRTNGNNNHVSEEPSSLVRENWGTWSTEKWCECVHVYRVCMPTIKSTSLTFLFHLRFFRRKLMNISILPTEYNARTNKIHDTMSKWLPHLWQTLTNSNTL